MHIAPLYPEQELAKLLCWCQPKTKMAYSCSRKTFSRGRQVANVSLNKALVIWHRAL